MPRQKRTDFCYDPDVLLKGVVKERPKASEDEVKKAAELLNGAKRPLIVAGHGVIISNAEKELAELAEKGNIPVATTLLGISALPSDFDKLVGTVGHARQHSSQCHDSGGGCASGRWNAVQRQGHRRDSRICQQRQKSSI